MDENIKVVFPTSKSSDILEYRDRILKKRETLCKNTFLQKAFDDDCTLNFCFKVFVFVVVVLGCACIVQISEYMQGKANIAVPIALGVAFLVSFVLVCYLDSRNRYSTFQWGDFNKYEYVLPKRNLNKLSFMDETHWNKVTCLRCQKKELEKALEDNMRAVKCSDQMFDVAYNLDNDYENAVIAELMKNFLDVSNGTVNAYFEKKQYGTEYHYILHLVEIDDGIVPTDNFIPKELSITMTEREYNEISSRLRRDGDMDFTAVDYDFDRQKRVIKDIKNDILKFCGKDGLLL